MVEICALHTYIAQKPYTTPPPTPRPDIQGTWTISILDSLAIHPWLLGLCKYILRDLILVLFIKHVCFINIPQTGFHHGQWNSIHVNCEVSTPVN